MPISHRPTAFVHRYIDIPECWEEIVVHYILMTWVHDCFTALPYLRFLGEAGTGKSRLLQICANLCYRGICAGGSTTASPMFRLIEIYGGTLALDEADFKSSDAWADIIKILNSGYMRGTPVIRSEKVGDSYEPKTYDVFGPKVIANRHRFSDYALESRCFTYETQEGSPRKDILRQLPAAFFDEARDLRNKLLKWRFENFARIKPDESSLLNLEPRLTQIGTPIYSVSEDPDFRERFVSFLVQSGSEQRGQRPQALVIQAMVGLKRSSSGLMVGSVAEEARRIASSLGMDAADFTPKRVGALIRSMGISPRRASEGYRFQVAPETLKALAERYGLPMNVMNV